MRFDWSSFLSLVFALLLFPALQNAATNVSACGTLNSAGTTYTMNQSINNTGVTCITIGAQNITFDCQGFSITGNNTTGIYGIYSSYSNTTIKNCIISAYGYGIRIDSGNANQSSIDNVSVADSGIALYYTSSSFHTLTNSLFNGSTNAINLQASSDNNISGVSAYSNGTAIYVQTTSSRNNITNSNATSYASGNGIGSTSATGYNNAFSGCVVQATGAHALDTRSLGNAVVNTVAIALSGAYSGIYATTNNAISGSWGYAYGTGYGIYLAGENSTVINSNGTANSTALSGVGIRSSGSNNTFTNVIGNSTIGRGIWLTSGSNANGIFNSIGMSNGSNPGINAYASNDSVLLNSTGISANGTGISVDTGSSRINVSNCTGQGGNSTSGYGIYVSASANVTVSNGSRGLATLGTGIYFESTATGGVLNGSFGNSSSNNGIYASSASTTIINATGRSDSSYGIYIGGNSSTASNVTGTSTSGTGMRIGASYVNVTNSIAISNSSNGIWLTAGSSYNTIINLTASSSSLYGMQIHANATGNSVVNSSITSVAYYGLYFTDASSRNNSINGTSIYSGAGIGIYNVYGANNTIDCQGRSITGGNSTYGTYGIYNYNNDSVVKNCIIQNFSFGIYNFGSVASGDASHSMPINTTDTFTNNTIQQSYTPDASGILYPRIHSPSYMPTITTRRSGNSLSVTCNMPNSSSAAIDYSFGSGSYANATVTQSFQSIPNVYTIGDSLTAGLHYEPTLDALMGSNSSNHNFGYNGGTCMVAYQQYQANIPAGNNITVVALCGINDVRTGYSVANTTFYMESIYNLSLASNHSLVFLTIGPGNGTDTNVTACANMLAVNEWLTNFTTAHNVTLVDFYHMYWNGSNCTSNSSLTNDGTHPNALGDAMMGNLVWRQGFNHFSPYSASINLSAISPISNLSVRCYLSGAGSNVMKADFYPNRVTSSCANLSVANAYYALNQSVSINGATCFNITAANVTLDCNGYGVAGNNTPGTYGAYSNWQNTAIMNCNISGFPIGADVSNSANGSITNSTMTSSNINTSGVSNLSVSVNNGAVSFTSGSSQILAFNFNFSNASLNFSAISISNSTADGKSFFSISGIPQSGLVGAKNITIYGANAAYGHVCIKDEENVASITPDCSNATETRVQCDGATHNGYTCLLSGATLTVTGLNHSGVQQYQPSAAPSTGGDGTSGTAISLSRSYSCPNNALKITATSATGAISGLVVRLYKSGTTDYVSGKTDSSGAAYFTAVGGNYYAETQRSPPYAASWLDTFQVTSCAPSQPQPLFAPGQPSQPAINNTPSGQQPTQPVASTAPSAANNASSTTQPAQQPSDEPIGKKATDSAIAQLPVSDDVKKAVSEVAQPAIPLAMVGGGIFAIMVAMAAYLLFIRKKK